MNEVLTFPMRIPSSDSMCLTWLETYAQKDVDTWQHAYMTFTQIMCISLMSTLPIYFKNILTNKAKCCFQISVNILIKVLLKPFQFNNKFSKERDAINNFIIPRQGQLLAKVS